MRPHHKKTGVPRFLPNHHQQTRKGLEQTPRMAGRLSVREAVEALGVSEAKLRRLDAELFAGTSRGGVRFFTPAEIDALRKALPNCRPARGGRRS